MKVSVHKCVLCRVRSDESEGGSRSLDGASRYMESIATRFRGRELRAKFCATDRVLEECGVEMQCFRSVKWFMFC